MEMQQVRYFVSLAKTLNFTQAADLCNVTQPALTRAIKALEAELGGDLLRREGRQTHLTDLGQRMLPLLSQCYESARAAKEVAKTLAVGTDPTFAVGLCNTIDLSLMTDALSELLRAVPGLRLRLRRGDADQLINLLKSGEIEVAVAGPLKGRWDRLDGWPLFCEPYTAFLSQGHPLSASEGPLNACELHEAGYLRLVGGEDEDEEKLGLADAGLSPDRAHRVDALHDLRLLAGAACQAAVAPRSALPRHSFNERVVHGLTLTRKVSAFTVSGRPRTREAGAFLALIRTTPWTEVLDQAIA